VNELRLTKVLYEKLKAEIIKIAHDRGIFEGTNKILHGDWLKYQLSYPEILIERALKKMLKEDILIAKYDFVPWAHGHSAHPGGYRILLGYKLKRG